MSREVSAPFSKHSIAHAMEPPALMVSIPISSQRLDALITVFGSLTPTSGPMAKELWYSMRPVAFAPSSVVVTTCSQPIVQLAQWAFLTWWDF